MMLHRQTSAPYQSRFEENREHDDEWLQKKADELERLFEEHKRKIAASSSPPEVAEVVVRGEFYERYMRKRRDSKLRDRKWEVEREVREVKMKAMLETLERSRSAMMMMNSPLSHHHSNKTIARDRDQESVEKNFYEEEDQFSDSSSKRTSTKRSTLSSSTSRKPIPRPSARGISVSNLSADMIRKENTTKSSINVATNAHPTSFNRSKSASAAGVKFFKEEKPTISSKKKATLITASRIAVTDHYSLTESSVAASGKTRKKWGSAQVPAVLASRSFFSLPSFRNRGDDSKLGR